MNQATGTITISDGVTTFTIGEAGVSGTDANLGGTTDLDFFTTVIGTQGDDAITGIAGADVIVGGAGSNAIFGGDGDDTVSAEFNSGNKELHGDAGADTVTGGEGLDTIYGGEGADSLDGEAGNDIILGGIGNDTILGGEGADVIYGGSLQTDVISVEGFGATPSGWTNLSTGTAYTNRVNLDGNQIMGRAGGNGTGAEQLQKAYDLTDGADHAVIEFDFYKLDSWDGDRQESFTVYIDGVAAFTYDPFGNNSTSVGFQGTDASGTFPGGRWEVTSSGVDSQLGFGPSEDRIYEVRIVLDNPGDSVTLGIGTNLDQSTSDESWAIDNVAIVSTDDPDYRYDPAENDSLIGGAGDDSIYGGVGNDTVEGGDGADVLFGGLGNDSVAGGADNDNLSGDAGNDTLDGGDGNDVIAGGIGADLIFAGAGDDTVTDASIGNTLNDGADTVHLGDGNDVFIGSGRGVFDRDLIFGDAGNDAISVGQSNDTVYGGDGDDLITSRSEIASFGDSLFGDAGNDTIIAGNTIDHLDGGTGNDSLSAGGGNDTLFGGDGTDTLFGGLGNDSAFGGGGDDLIQEFGPVGTAVADGDTVTGTIDSERYIVSGDAGSSAKIILDDGSGTATDADLYEDVIYVIDTGDAASLTVEAFTYGVDRIEVSEPWVAVTATQIVPGNHQVTLTYNNGDTQTFDIFHNSGSNFDPTLVFFTFSGNDTLDGGTGNDTIDGAFGDDLIYGGGDNDSILGGSGNDWLTGEAGDDTVDGGDGDDSVFGAEGNDLLRGGAGNDSIHAWFGNDTLEGGAGNDYLDGGDGDDVLFGGEGNDTLLAGSDESADFLDGGDGDDELSAGSGNDTLLGGAGADNQFAAEGDDILDGGEGDDTLQGFLGNDTIDGGAGNDFISGGDGGDTFIYEVGDGLDTIVDFNSGNTGTLTDGDVTTNDFIDLSAFYSTIHELRDDYADDGILNQSNSGNLVKGRVVDYSDNSSYDTDGIANNEGIVFIGQTPDANSFTKENTGVICFTPGTLILTETGQRPVETLQPGDRIVTRDNGLQTLQWLGKRQIGASELRANEKLRPVLIRPDLIGAVAPLLVSQQHGVLLRPEGKEETLVRAIHLARLQGGQARVAKGIRHVTYIHLMFDAHQIVFANGAPSESFYPGPIALAALGNPARAELNALFPALLLAPAERTFGPRARLFAHPCNLPPTLHDLHVA